MDWRWRRRARIGAAAAAAVVATAIAWLALRAESTPPRPAGGHHPGATSVAELIRLPIGGVEQVLLIRGRSTANPVLLFLHGGPGMPTMFLAHEFQERLEETFVVVQWDRRGAGKSYAAREPVAALNVPQLVADAIEVTEYLRERFKQDRIFLVGHSWGTVLGLRAVAARPDLYAAYVGTGQLAGTEESLQRERRRILEATARATGEQKLVQKAKDGLTLTEDDMFAAGCELVGAKSFWPLLGIGLRAPEYTLRDVLNVPKGASLWQERVAGERPLDWLAGHVTYEVPIYFLLGRHDCNTPSSLAAAYLDVLQAPAKGLAWFEHAAHFPFLEQPEAFAEEMSKVREQAMTYWQR